VSLRSKQRPPEHVSSCKKEPTTHQPRYARGNSTHMSRTVRKESVAMEAGIATVFEPPVMFNTVQVAPCSKHAATDVFIAPAT
jgi:hypothetical protein